MKKFKKALIIDDDHDLTMLLKTILGTSITSVVSAGTLKTGKEMAEQAQPDIIFLDNNLPDGQGIYNISAIKAMVPKAVLVMITAMSQSREAAIQNGADMFLEKPLTSANIQDVLSKVAALQT